MNKIRSLFLISIALFLVNNTLLAVAMPTMPKTDVPAKLKLPPKSLSTLEARFFSTTDLDGQFRLATMITKVMGNQKYDLLMKIAYDPVKGGTKYGATEGISMHARILALNYIASNANIKYRAKLEAILKIDPNKYIRIAAVKALGKIKSPDATHLLVNLIKFDLNHKDFDESNDKHNSDDIVVEAIVEVLGEVGDPKAFTALLNIVTRQNHRAATIVAAWKAMELLKW